MAVCATALGWFRRWCNREEAKRVGSAPKSCTQQKSQQLSWLFLIWLPDLKSKWILIYWFYLIKIHSPTYVPTKYHYKTFAVIPDFKVKLSHLQYKSSTKRMNWGIYTVSQTAAIIHRPTLKGQAVAYPPNYRLRRFHPNSMKAKCVSVLFF